MMDSPMYCMSFSDRPWSIQWQQQCPQVVTVQCILEIKLFLVRIAALEVGREKFIHLFLTEFWFSFSWYWELNSRYLTTDCISRSFYFLFIFLFWNILSRFPNLSSNLPSSFLSPGVQHRRQKQPEIRVLYMTFML